VEGVIGKHPEVTCSPAAFSLGATPFNLPRRAVRYPSQCSHIVIYDDCLPVALFLVVRKFAARGKKKVD
jgi:hypothetical protein